MVPFLLFLLFFVFPLRVHAVYDPLSVPNNKFGIHIADTNDLPDVSPLVNSTGGDWGYVTVVIPETDRNSGKWQKIFDEMRRLHLIPLVRLATRTVDDHWTKPTAESIKDWVPFLSNLNWPIENRYVILFNEPNHAKEWGSTINPKEYAEVAVNLAKTLKTTSEDFFILPAGLDASAATDGQSLDEEVFLSEVVKEKPEFLTLFDGWTSHSYPNPGFSGSAYARGRGTLGTFYWEVNVLRRLGLKKDLPVFITETGWQHSQGKVFNNRLLSPEAVGANLQIAASGIWTNLNVAAVTPFIFSYQDEPFDHFSWKKYRDSGFYEHYYQYQKLTKTKGEPRQREAYRLEKPLIPASLVSSSIYHLTAEITNVGQGILSQTDGYELVMEDARKAFPTLLVDQLPTLEPNETGKIALHVRTNKTPGIYPIILKIKHGENEVELIQDNLVIVPPPTLRLAAQLGWRGKSDASESTVLIYDTKETLISKFSGLKLENGLVSASGLVNIIPGEKYRVVLLVPYYLPRQAVVTIGKTATEVKLKRLLPVDFDNDGGLNLDDLVALLQTKPNAVISRFVGP